MRNERGAKQYFGQILLFDLVDHRHMVDPSAYAIAGGSIRDYFAGDKIKDIDVFCKSAKAAEDLVVLLKELGAEEMDMTSRLANLKYKGQWIQIVRGEFFDVTDSSLINQFDFTVCMAMMTINTDQEVILRTGLTFYQDLLAKHLRLNNPRWPLSSLERTQKFIRKGYTVCNETFLDLVKAIQKIDLNDRDQNRLEFYPSGDARFPGVAK